MFFVLFLFWLWRYFCFGELWGRRLRCTRIGAAGVGAREPHSRRSLHNQRKQSLSFTLSSFFALPGATRNASSRAASCVTQKSREAAAPPRELSAAASAAAELVVCLRPAILQLGFAGRKPARIWVWLRFVELSFSQPALAGGFFHHQLGDSNDSKTTACLARLTHRQHALYCNDDRHLAPALRARVCARAAAPAALVKVVQGAASACARLINNRAAIAAKVCARTDTARRRCCGSVSSREGAAACVCRRFSQPRSALAAPTARTRTPLAGLFFLWRW